MLDSLNNGQTAISADSTTYPTQSLLLINRCFTFLSVFVNPITRVHTVLHASNANNVILSKTNIVHSSHRDVPVRLITVTPNPIQ